MRAIHIDGNGALSVQLRPVPVPGPGEMLLRTETSSLCGTDLHRFRGARSYANDTDVYGHESVGIVEASNAAGFAVGDRVLHAPFPHEGKVFATYQIARETNAVVLPQDLAPGIGVFAQQLGTIVYAMRQFWPWPRPPKSAFVAGAGPAGLMFIQLLRARGCPEVYVSEPDRHRRDLALSFGAVVAEPATTLVELSVDAAGTPGVRLECWGRAAPFGTMGIYGLPDVEPGDLEVSVLALVSKNLRMAGAIGSQGEPGLVSFREAIDLITSGRVEVGALVSHRIGLDELPALAPRAAHDTEGIVKILVDFPVTSVPSPARKL